jgi:hypothetical protein
VEEVVANSGTSLEVSTKNFNRSGPIPAAISKENFLTQDHMPQPTDSVITSAWLILTGEAVL